MLYISRTVRPLRFLLFLLAASGLYWVSGFPRTYDDDELPPSQRSNAPAAIAFDQLIVSVKTTTSDAWTELPPLLVVTDPEYYNSLLLMGDWPLNIGSFRIEDLLDRYTDKFVGENSDLERYRKTMEYSTNSVEFTRLKEQDPAREKEVLANLDKYKMLRWVERTWLLRPERRWYIFAEPDVHLSRANLLSWLAAYNPQEYHFFANPPALAGGRAFILSEAAMKGIIVDEPDLIPYYDNNIHAHRNAYEVLATVLNSTLKLGPVHMWPSISQYNPATVPFGAGLWCQPILAMSNVPVDLLNEMYRFERARRDQQITEPLVFADLWLRFMMPEKLDTPREDWDNLSSGQGYGQWNILFDNAASHSHQHRSPNSSSGKKARSGEASWEACRDSCNENELCVQWSYSSLLMSNDNENPETKCHLSRSMKFGSHVEPREVERSGEKTTLNWTSGWNKERFHNWAKQQRCKNQQS